MHYEHLVYWMLCQKINLSLSQKRLFVSWICWCCNYAFFLSRMLHFRAFLSRMSWLRAFWGRILCRIFLRNTRNFGRSSQKYSEFRQKIWGKNWLLEPLMITSWTGQTLNFLHFGNSVRHWAHSSNMAPATGQSCSSSHVTDFPNSQATVLPCFASQWFRACCREVKFSKTLAWVIFWCLFMCRIDIYLSWKILILFSWGEISLKIWPVLKGKWFKIGLNWAYFKIGLFLIQKW